MEKRMEAPRFTDLSNQEQTVVQSIFGGEIDTAISASGSGSLLVNATNKGLLIGGDGDVVNDLGTGDFTIEFFYNSASEPGSYSWLICNGDVDDSPDSVGYGLGYIPGTNSFQVSLSANGTTLSNTTASLDTELGSPGTAGFFDGNWHHIALTRDSSDDVRLFVDGVGKLMENNGADLWVPPSGKLAFPGNSEGTGVNLAMTGNYDSLRITKGFCRYDADFTPPSADFGEVSGGGPGSSFGTVSTVVF
jgi:hypothetical protein